jgi:hypothetical protein
MAGALPEDFEDKAWSFIEEINAKAETIPTRKASHSYENSQKTFHCIYS